MTRKLKLALLAMLGFSTACSTIKNAPKGDAQDTTRTEKIRIPIMVMYGVRPPGSDADLQKRKQVRPDPLDPVMEQPNDDTPTLTPSQPKPKSPDSGSN